MARQKGSGSIILEILIVICFILMVLSLYVPKKIWDEENYETETCRSRMSAIWSLEQKYITQNEVYTDTLQYIVDMIKEDTTYTEAMIDTLLYGNHPDSLYNCISTGLPYSINLREDKLGIKIECPNEYKEIKYYIFFTKKINTHGSISDGERTWAQ